MTLMPKEKYYKCRCLGHQSGAAFREGAGSSLARGHPHLHDKLARLAAANEILKLVRRVGVESLGLPLARTGAGSPTSPLAPSRDGTLGRPLLPPPHEGEVGQGLGGPGAAVCLCVLPWKCEWVAEAGGDTKEEFKGSALSNSPPGVPL